MALSRKIKGVKHYAYESEVEFRTAHPTTPLIKEWRKADEGDWCVSDDGKIIQILKKDSLISKKKKPVPYIRTAIGMFTLTKTSRLKGTIKTYIYRFSTKNSTDLSVKAKNLTVAKKIFAKYIAEGMEPTEAYIKAYPTTHSKNYAEIKSKLLLRNKTVRQQVDKEIESIMSDVGITKRYLLESTKDIVDKGEAKDNDKLRAIETLMKISGMLNTEKKVDSVALIQEFTGFTSEKLKAFEKGILPKPPKKLAEVDG